MHYRDHRNTSYITRAALLFLLLTAPTCAQTKAPTADEPPHSAEAFFKRGVVAYQRGELDKALSDFDRAIELATRITPGAVGSRNIGVLVPEAAPLFYNRGVVRYDWQQWDDALLDFEEALNLDPAYVLAWIKLGNTQMRKDRPEAASQSYTHALKLDPRAVLAWNNR